MPYFGIPIRNGLPIGLGSVAGFGVQQFSPADLFSAGEQGAWYDPSDFSTLFTNSAGTTPVTAVEQFVGLMLDKSKGLVLGSELVTNGTFNSDVSGWTAGSTATISWDAGRMKITNIGAAFGYSYQSFPTVIGKTYKISANISVGTAGTVYLRAGISELSFSYFGQSTTTDGVLSGVFVATATTSYVHILNNNGTNAYSLSDNISVRELPGNHATQTTSAKRPKLAARYNLLTYSEQFDNAAWTKSNVTVTANAVVAPDGTTTADALFETAANSDHGARTAAGVTIASGVSYKLSFRVKSNGRNYVLIYINAPASGRYFDVTPGTAGAVLGNYTGTNLPATITALADNWFLCEVTFTASTTSVLCETYISSAGNNLTYAGDITKGIYIWGADLRPASQATGLIGPTYQRVVDAATYDTVGFLPYLEFNGLSWSMGTGSIDATAVDKAQVFAGARKLSDALYGTVIETSVDSDANNGSLAVFNPNSAKWDMRLKGNGLVGSSFSETYTAPLTNVLTLLANTAGATFAEKLIPRINGVVDQDSTTGAIGTGNFGNYPLYIGQRGGSSLPFNGWLSSLIVRFGANLSQGQIEATESWVNQKTGAF
jgi:hypothetical protein